MTVSGNRFDARVARWSGGAFASKDLESFQGNGGLRRDPTCLHRTPGSPGSRRATYFHAVLPFLVAVCLAAGPGVPAGGADPGSPPFDPAAYTRLLNEFVDEQGRVDYAGLAARGRPRMEGLIQGLANTDPGLLDRSHRMALYINAYNLFTLELVADHYPVTSIRKIPGVSGVTGTGQWKEKRWTVNRERLSLDGIEHEILRPMGEPRIHFALVCAARSCPPLARRAYTGETLDAMLDEQARRFNRSPQGLRTGLEGGLFGEHPVLRLSAIYHWFEGDFLGVAESLTAYVLPFASDEDRAFLEKHRKYRRVRFLDYDWGLNDAR